MPNDQRNTLAIVGARGLLAEALLQALADRPQAPAALHLLDIGEAVGETLSYAGRELSLGDAQAFDFSTVARVALFGEPAPALRQRALAAGCQVLDASGDLQLPADIPLLALDAGESLPAAVQQAALLAVPGGLSLSLLRALRPLHAAAGVQAASVACYQSVSISGRAATEELGRQTIDLLNFRPIESRVFPRRIAFNLIPKLGDWCDDGASTAEQRIVRETRRLLGDDAPALQVDCVQVPMFYGFGAAVSLQLTQPLSLDAAAEQLSDAAELLYADQADAFPTPADDEAQDGLVAGRLRADPSRPNGLALWLAGDELRLAAENAVRVLEQLARGHDA